MLYYLYEMNHAAIAPWRAAADTANFFWKNPGNPFAQTYMGRSMAASLDLFERVTRRYGKPSFGIDYTVVAGDEVPVVEERVFDKTFCSLIHFSKSWADEKTKVAQPKLLIVAPMSGHYATLLRGTVEAMLPHADVYITDWVDARQVPLSSGAFDLDDYIDYVIEMLQFLGPDTHVMGVCQPSVPVLAAIALMAKRQDPNQPKSMILMGGPIDTRRNPTVVNRLAVARGVDWFRKNAVVKVPFPHPGALRDVYPGFLQLTGFMTMNLDRHMNAHRELFWHLIEGDGDAADKHTDFYDEYLSVMDLTAEFYLQTVEKVFVNHELPRGIFRHRGELVDPAAITRTALMTIEGERDDISGVGQTEAAHDLCSSLASEKKLHLLQRGVGHYGVFNGSRFRADAVPRIVDFIHKQA
ncbi:polyhydroxyalkanoate depolymerase [Nordella sp. HKS 07]|uniref:polyhydroxyalkanoate depolymerase n=1 Tax=Nordella sp. HKS 07 TaxID=2712222 RepID=UPI0013E12017|nr:polyhydroxyalkanoate depolymerase [Nordella sp. HKS 07]QIG48667.1 polyhydroxyalkanoate depolymerase [Nordella sp. HKS 07]